MEQMLQLHSLSSRCGEWRTSKVTFLQWQLPLCITSVLMIVRFVKGCIYRDHYISIGITSKVITKIAVMGCGIGISVLALVEGSGESAINSISQVSAYPNDSLRQHQAKTQRRSSC